ncbi:hypothetical protein M0811_11773 [Anaeramoeba ignava]|uniref:Uncharacterized protein n=1 Tax=Anaeramoeba ignava TaxID=1746090 RepID=A0A9Q0LAS8_ANAIG|nr:hypothetical protein M0811_11773 [Anaeramoeba ignava]
MDATTIYKAATTKFSKYARWICLVAAVAFLICGIIDCFYLLGVGIFCIVFSIPLAMIEVPWPACFSSLLGDIVGDFRFRGVIYIVLSIPPFFSKVTVVCGIILIIGGILYVISGFKGEKATEKKSGHVAGLI